MSTAAEKPTVLRPPVKQSAIPLPQAERVEEAPEGAPAPRQAKPKPVCPECSIEEMPNGEGVARIIIPPDVLKRLKNRSQGVSVSEFTWSTVIRPALYGATY